MLLADFSKIKGGHRLHRQVLARPWECRAEYRNGPGWTNVDLRFTKKFILRRAVDKPETTCQIALRADAFNVLNRTNYKNYVGTVTSPLLGFANDAYPARELPLGIRSSF